jgi:hypothetical protein
MSEAGIKAESDFFKAQICSQESNATACNANVDKYWPTMSTAAFKQDELPKMICDELKCTAKFER